MTPEFQAREQMLKDLGIRYHVDREYRPRAEGPGREPHPIGVFTTVDLPLTPEDWCRLCMRPGEEYMGGCCSTMSGVQDQFNAWFRDGGWAKCTELSDVAEAFVAHGDKWWAGIEACAEEGLWEGTLGDYVAHAKNPEVWENLSSLDRLHLTWLIVKDHYAPKVPEARPEHVGEWERAVRTLARSAWHLDLCNIFEGLKSDDPSPERPADSASKMRDLITFHRLVPALRTVWQQVEEHAPPALEGFALIEKEKGPEAIAENSLGPCIYSSMEGVEEILTLWRQNDAERENVKVPIDERIGVRPVRVSVEDGLVFTGDLL